MSRPLHTTLEALAEQTIPDVGPFFGDEGAESVAKLARLIDQAECRRGGVLLRDSRTFEALPERQRTGNKVAVIRVVQALVMLGWIEVPT
jgi:hypothetical protein